MKRSKAVAPSRSREREYCTWSVNARRSEMGLIPVRSSSTEISTGRGGGEELMGATAYREARRLETGIPRAPARPTAPQGSLGHHHHVAAPQGEVLPEVS